MRSLRRRSRRVSGLKLTPTHAIIIVGGHRKPLWSRFRTHGAGSRYVVSVDERGEVTMIPAEPKRN